MLDSDGVVDLVHQQQTLMTSLKITTKFGATIYSQPVFWHNDYV